MALKLEDFDVSPTLGFVPDNPLVRLPEYFDPWERLCDELPTLWKNRTTRSAIEKLPLLDYAILSSQKEWQRADVVLTAMAHSYVWCFGEQGAVKILPKCIAVPLFGVSRHLGLPPIINHYVFALCNWRRASADSDLELITTFTGTKSEEGFFLNAVLVELEFGKGGAVCLVTGQQAILNADIDTLINSLITLQNIIHNMISAFIKIHDVTDAEEFYDLLRPFMNGWNEGSVLEDGLVYEGVSTKPMKYFGGSAAQSSVFQAIDGFLEIPHQTNTGDEHFLTKMRMYMPPKHRAFIEAIESGPSLKDFVLKKKNSLLTEKYNSCIDAMKKYRSLHLNVVTKYIIIQANKNPKNVNIKLSNTGTGGSDLLPFLKKIRNETEEQRIK
ncbi:indoleamine 2,3-dioxygenase 2-like isoform X2 [Actinia tenebrosa]|uniref:Indoleamine 2,3-dioxygenase 2-like isoform X2 n=1 Tax=Actinia tenebrosa TaxID=6105 RepID=A0A6P8IUE9_ACTTE|nr:indoleamine 2,3-dioxygenase 2-like isoform X2 [Actinia tenebrosa]